MGGTRPSYRKGRLGPSQVEDQSESYTVEPRAHIPAQLWGIAGSRQRRGWEAEPRAAARWGPGAQGAWRPP